MLDCKLQRESESQCFIKNNLDGVIDENRLRDWRLFSLGFYYTAGDYFPFSISNPKTLSTNSELLLKLFDIMFNMCYSSHRNGYI